MAEVATVSPKHLLKEGTPAEIRAAILPEDVETFEREYAAALQVAGQEYRLDDLDACLESWRRIAAMTAHHGHDAQRDMLARADYILQHGRPRTGTVTYTADDMRRQLCERLNGGRR